LAHRRDADFPGARPIEEKRAELAAEAAQTAEVDEDDTDEVEVEDAPETTTKTVKAVKVNHEMETVQRESETEKD